jgi:hypothetical protein
MDFHQRVLDICFYLLGCHFGGRNCNVCPFLYVCLTHVVQHVTVKGLSRVAYSSLSSTKILLHFSIIHEIGFEPFICIGAIYIGESHAAIVILSNIVILIFEMLFR